MKTSTPQRAIGSSAIQPKSRCNSFTREQLPLRNLPDCLLAAYDEISRRAFGRFVARGSNAGSEIADWRAAERDLFLRVEVDFEETPNILYALASVAGCSGMQIEVAIEDRWLLIWGHVDAENDCHDGLRRLTRQDSRGLDIEWVGWEDLHSVLRGSDELNDSVYAAAEDDQFRIARPVTARPFCVVELPARVDISRSAAVLSDGLVAIRMPKVKGEAPFSAAQQI